MTKSIEEMFEIDDSEAASILTRRDFPLRLLDMVNAGYDIIVLRLDQATAINLAADIQLAVDQYPNGGHSEETLARYFTIDSDGYYRIT